MKSWKQLLIAIALISCTTGCYHMPTEDDYCVLPMTNNPHFQRKSDNPMAPGMPPTY